MFTVGRLARLCGLSRSTLLYYDSVGVLRPSGRSRANYRLYTEEDRRRLETIRRYRDAGLSLEEIKELLTAPGGESVEILEGQLGRLNQQIAELRQQQRVVIDLLRNRASFQQARALDKKSWVAVLRASGLDEDDMDRWHREFERLAPEAHQDFLESLGIPPEEIESIRAWSRD